MDHRISPADSEAVAEPSTGEPWRLPGCTDRILNKVKGLPSLALAEVCVCNSAKASIEQLWSPGVLKKAEPIHWLFFSGISVLKYTLC